MRTRERILTIRLMEKLRKDPEYAKALGIEIQDRLNPGSKKPQDRTGD